MFTPRRLLTFLFFLPTLLSAQDILESGALVYYYDGSIFQGAVVNEDELQISLRLSTSDTITVEKAFMDRFYRIPDDIQLYKRRRFHYNSGIFQTFSLTLTFDPGLGNSSQLDYLIAKRINSRVSAGLGTGFYFNDSFLSGFWFQTNFVPIYAYGRYYLSQRRRRFYAAGRLGYSIPLEDGFNGSHSGGMMFMPEVGIHFAGRKKARFSLGIGQYLQHTKGDNLDFDSFGNPIEARFKVLLNRTLLRLAWEFW